MAVDPLNTWKSTLKALTPVDDDTWATNFANWYNDRITSIVPDATKLDTSTGFTFTFDKATFASELKNLAPTMDKVAGTKGFADAWQTAIANTIYPSTLTVAPGAFIPPSSNTTLFSAVNSVLLDPASVSLAYAKLLTLAAAPVVSDTDNSIFPQTFRDATLLLTITVVGLDTTPTPTGPLPLTAAAVPLT